VRRSKKANAALLAFLTHPSEFLCQGGQGGELGRSVLLTLLDWAVLVMLSREHGGLKEGEAFSTLNRATHALRNVNLGLEVGGVGLFWLYMDK
jgi:hypothetical protein